MTHKGVEGAGAAPHGWLPPGKRAAILFSIDDVHPASRFHGADAGGDLGAGMLGRLGWLMDRHPELHTTLCVTPAWRPKSPRPTRQWLTRVPWLARRLYLADRWPAHTMRIDRHPAFIAYLKAMPRIEIVPHGLTHMQRGPNGPIEFERASEARCRRALRTGARIFAAAGLAVAPGHSPPGWAAPAPLRRALVAAGLRFVASARDIVTPVGADACTAMSGLHGQPLIFPGRTAEGLVHIPVNFQATSDFDRADAILGLGGLLSIKAHAIKRQGDYVALDGLDADYAGRLDALLTRCKDRHGEALWWPSMTAIAERMDAAAP